MGKDKLGQVMWVRYVQCGKAHLTERGSVK